MYDNQDLFLKAIDIVKEAVRGGNSTNPGILVESTFSKLLELAKANGLSDG